MHWSAPPLLGRCPAWRLALSTDFRLAMKNRNFLFIVILVVTGCSTAHIAPSSGPTATIDLKNSSSAYAGIAVFEDAHECYRSHSTTPLGPGKATEIQVRAGLPLAMHYQQRGFTGGPGLEAGLCNIIITFRPEPSRRYSSALTDSSTGCSVDIVEVGEDGASHPVVVVNREYTPPMGFTNKWCPSLTEQQALRLR